MIQQKYTRIFHTEHRPVETGVIIQDEGVALVYVKEGDRTVVRPSTGAPGERLAGLALSRNAPPLFVPFVQEGKVEGSELELPRTPIAGQILVRLDGEAVTLSAGTTPTNDGAGASTSVALEDNVLYFGADQAGKQLYVQMMFEPTVTEARQYNGDVPVGGLPSSAQGIIGVITKGDVATSYYDAAADWSSAITCKLGPDGILTTEGNGNEAKDVTIISAPTAANPLLVINLD